MIIKHFFLFLGPGNTVVSHEDLSAVPWGEHCGELQQASPLQTKTSKTTFQPSEVKPSLQTETIIRVCRRQKNCPFVRATRNSSQHPGALSIPQAAQLQVTVSQEGEQGDISPGHQRSRSSRPAKPGRAEDGGQECGPTSRQP